MNEHLVHELQRRAERSPVRGADAVLAGARHDVATGRLGTVGPDQPARPRWVLAAAAAVLVAGLGVGVVALRNGDDEPVGVTSRSETFCDVLSSEVTTGLYDRAPDGFTPDLRVYLEPGISAERRTAILAVLESDPAVRSIHHVDEEATYAEFLRLYGGLAEAPPVASGQLPTSYLVDAAQPEDLRGLEESLVGVAEVEQRLDAEPMRVLDVASLGTATGAADSDDGTGADTGPVVVLRPPPQWPTVLDELRRTAPDPAVADAVSDLIAAGADRDRTTVTPEIAAAYGAIVDAGEAECGLEPLFGPGS